MAALWALLATLPLPREQHAALDFFVGGAGAVQRVQDFIDRDGAFVLRFTVQGRDLTALLAPA
ncbi:hypothetical protein [Streptomyces sp. CB03911]|uniref:hypothetical protein n=1 Tax=Streptomyces sp. CB03911 TaxID=1804758 RepID=UPI00093D083F|nr:hypothetical protein [Streptomyces sp. CB03911]OKI22183.1 hypothetical protein A6A07_34475 [Streptomyces sp. CB03911]